MANCTSSPLLPATQAASFPNAETAPSLNPFYLKLAKPLSTLKKPKLAYPPRNKTINIVQPSENQYTIKVGSRACKEKKKTQVGNLWEILIKLF